MVTLASRNEPHDLETVMFLSVQARRLAPMRVLVTALAVGLGATSVDASAQPQAVAVTTIVEHPALDAIRAGTREGLKRAGFGDENLRWQYQSAQGNTATASQIARQFVGSRPAVIVAIATPSAQSVVAATKAIPVVFAGVTDPVAAQLLKNWGPSGTNVTGVSDQLALEQQIELIQQIVPGAKRVGMVHNPGEANSAVVVRALQTLLPKSGMTLVEAAAPRTVDVGAAARSLIGRVDVLYSATDNNVSSAYESLVKVANDAKIPLVSGEMAAVARGAVASLGIDYHQLGLQAGAIVARILQGEAPGAIVPQTVQKLALHVNLSAAHKQGITLPPDLIKSAAHVVK
jgi:putative ABC transport system substrate-binding protein